MTVVTNDNGCTEYLAELVRYEPDEAKAWFNFDLGFSEWHVKEVRIVSWFPREWQPGQTFTVFLHRKGNDKEYYASVWMRED